MDLDRYLRLAYEQDYGQLYDMNEDELRREFGPLEKPKSEFTDRELDALSRTLRGLLTYDSSSRSTPENLLNSPWFKEQGNIGCT